MGSIIFNWLQTVAVFISLTAFLIASAKIRKLEEQLEEEKRKRTFPLLTFNVNRDDLKVYLTNDSYCYARNITFDDMNITADLGFKKHLTVKFDPIDMLKPNQQVQLNYNISDGEYDLTDQSPDSVVLQFHNKDFNLHILYQNLEEDKFISTIAWQKNQYVTKEAKPLD